MTHGATRNANNNTARTTAHTVGNKTHSQHSMVIPRMHSVLAMQPQQSSSPIEGTGLSPTQQWPAHACCSRGCATNSVCHDNAYISQCNGKARIPTTNTHTANPSASNANAQTKLHGKHTQANTHTHTDLTSHLCRHTNSQHTCTPTHTDKQHQHTCSQTQEHQLYYSRSRTHTHTQTRRHTPIKQHTHHYTYTHISFHFDTRA